ncbi:MAG: DUF87 domain-containing protein [Euryarchaeota archaeon]|nr:DUF87 domain-containing protein [Euryarchaeota archaeon]
MVENIYNFFELRDFENIPDGHGAIFGKTGSGKTSLLHFFSRLLSEKNETVIVLDPHGDLVKNLLIPKKSIFISPLFRYVNDRKMAINMNLMETEKRDELGINIITETLKMLFSMDIDYSQGTWGPRLETVFSTIVPEVMNNIENATLLDIENTLINRDFNASNYLKSLYGRAYYDYIQSTMNKLTPITTNPFLREFICSKNVSFSFLKNDIRGKVVNIYLAKQELGEFLSRMAGSAVLSMILNATKFKKIRDATIIIDEIKDFSPYLLPGLFSESRKFNIRIIIAAQYVNQLSKDLYDSIMGNISWIASFKVSPEDSMRISKKFSPENLRIENTLLNLPDRIALFKEKQLGLYRIGEIIKFNNEEIIDDAYIKYGNEIDYFPDDILGLIYSIEERGNVANFVNIKREYESLSRKENTNLDSSLRILQLNGCIAYNNGVFKITENGIRRLSENNSNQWETVYHRYMVSRAAEFFRSLGFNVRFPRKWMNDPDLLAKNDKFEIYVEAEYGDIKSPGKIVNHLIQWKNKRILFLTFRQFSWKLFKILCMPAIVDDDGKIIFYKNGKNIVDFREAGDYSRNVWIGIVPDPGTLGTLQKFSPLRCKNLEIEDLKESDLFFLNGLNIFDEFENKLYKIKDGKIIRRCDYFDPNKNVVNND